ncbi:hypothetical protein RM553_17350 [Zunongwangia sp. F363]|uniref:DUF541 domain-containing protein n=1 Tax=Autumnicola tepida TaxID=3075595 RepID=A0ABU3CE67_9FLAO|nr:hypothetical protein [Zunongwangia sp. F363]MDT0644609.1 hypothetical protein [Zunongwangia sp. F363]
MKKIVNFKVFLLGIFLWVGQSLTAQTYIQEKVVDEKILEASLNGLGIITTKPNFNAVESNAVALKQIGDYNQAKIRTQTKYSDIQLTQEGDYNETKLNYTANTAIAKLLQEGNNNKIKDYVNQAGANISLELEQKGDNKIFEREGANELTQSFKFIQTDATPSLIIRSYN